MSNTPPAPPPPSDPVFIKIFDTIVALLQTLGADPIARVQPIDRLFLHIYSAVSYCAARVGFDPRPLLLVQIQTAGTDTAAQVLGKGIVDAASERVARSVPVALPLTSPQVPGAPGLDSGSALACCGRVDCPHIDAGPETLTREEAETRLEALEGADLAFDNMMADLLEDPRAALQDDLAECARSCGVDPERAKDIFRAYVRHLDKQAPEATSNRSRCVLDGETGARGALCRFHATGGEWKGPVSCGADECRSGRRAAPATSASMPYRPTDEQHQHPLCHALGMAGVTEREAIEALYRANVTQTATIMRLARWQPITPILPDATYTNPTADRLALTGRSKALAEMMRAHLGSVRRSFESGHQIDSVLDLANLEDLIEPFAATLAHVENLASDERQNAANLLRQAAERFEKGEEQATGQDVRERCRARASELRTQASYIERGDRALVD